MAVKILMSRSATGTVPRATPSQGVVVAVADGEALGERQRRDRLVAANSRAG